VDKVRCTAFAGTEQENCLRIASETRTALAEESRAS
jgi:hypothetical protein